MNELVGLAKNVLEGKNTYRYWQERLAAEPEAPEALRAVAERLAVRNRTEESIATWRRLAAIPADRNPHADEAGYMAICLREQLDNGNGEIVMAVIKDLEAYADARTGQWRRIALYKIGGDYDWQERHAEARKAFQKVIDEFPGTETAENARRRIRYLDDGE